MPAIEPYHDRTRAGLVNVASGCYGRAMHRRNLLLTFVASLVLATTARATDPEIFTGYGKTRWGQTVEEVMAVYPQMKEVSRYRELKKVPLDSPTTEDASGFPVDRFFSALVPEPLQEMVFGFADGKLYLIEIAFSTQTRAKLDDLALAQLVWKKYFSTEEAREQMTKHPFIIHVISHESHNTTDRPQQPDQLFYPNIYQYGNFDLGVSYEDHATESRAFDAAALRKQAVVDQRLRETEKAVDELGVRDLL